MLLSLYIIYNTMQKRQKIFMQLYKNHVCELTPLLLKTFTNKKSDNVLLNKTTIEKNINQNKNNIKDSCKQFMGSNYIEHISNKVINKQENTNNTYFASLLRFSKFIQLGNIEEKIVTGKIFQVVNNDLYIDFGWKFHCVCSNPMQNNSKFVKGATVYLQIKDLEISTRFLGSDVDTTILESDCILLGLIKENKLII